ncbi:MAG: hypothetical protein E7314_02990 [Clostridiales bacterium]|nr:hypothetical protein [Clostridiales bacterium]
MEFVLLVLGILLYFVGGFFFPLMGTLGGIEGFHGDTTLCMVTMLIVLAICGIYFSILPAFTNMKKKGKIITCIAIAVIYAAAIACGITGLVLASELLIRVFSIVCLTNLAATTFSLGIIAIAN